MCYLRYRDGMDELNRAQREQEIFPPGGAADGSGGNLVRLPELYASYHGSVKSSLSRKSSGDDFPLPCARGTPRTWDCFNIPATR
jgi:hypothetical protein